MNKYTERRIMAVLAILVIVLLALAAFGWGSVCPAGYIEVDERLCVPEGS